jgi:hypothetical protein
MAMTLAEIRAKLQANDNRGGGKKEGGGDNAVYAHWNAPEGTTARVRFLADGNPKNDFFWVTREIIKLPFAGVKGQTDSKPVIVQVPCMEMYGKDTPCPILAEVRPWFNDKSLEDMGRKYWKKKSYIFQGFVRENPVGDDKTPENPIRRFTISPQIINIIIASLKDPEMENMPTDVQAGLDFNIKKTSKGGYADYSTSTWARKETALTVDEQEAIDKFGLYNLSEFLPKKPGEVELKVIKEMFEASINGEPYDAERWGNYYKPYGLEVPSNAAAKPASAPAPTPAPVASAPVAESAPAPWEDDEGTAEASAPVATPAAKPATSQKAEDILAMIRNRQKQ